MSPTIPPFTRYSIAKQLVIFGWILGINLLPDQVALRVAVVVAILALLFVWWWSRTHSRPAGMAAVLAGRSGRGVVLLITDTAVLTTTQRGGFLKPVGPARPASPLPGLVAISAEGEKLVLGFADGSLARMRQSQPTKGFAARAAAWAAPALEALVTVDPLKTGPRRWQS